MIYIIQLVLLLLLLEVSPSIRLASGSADSKIISSQGFINYESSTNRLIGFNYIRTSMHWYEYTAIEAHFDLIRYSGANMVRLGINKWAWENNPIVSVGIPYRDHMLEVMSWLRDMNLVVIISAQIGTERHDDWTRERKAELIVTSSLQIEWINTFSDVISTLDPDGIDLMNEPPPSKFSPVSLSNQEYFNRYRAFMEDCVHAYRSIKQSLLIFVESAPFWDMSYIANNPLNDENIFYSFHCYPANVQGLSNGQALLDAWDTNPEEAKRLWREWILTPGYYAPLGGTGIGVQAVIDAGLTPYNMEMGCTLFDPYWQDLVQYHYELMDELGIGFSQFQIIENPGLPDRYGMLNPSGTELNEIGVIWYNNMRTRAQ